jgi:hypothetical protein
MMKDKEKTCSGVVTSSEFPVIMGRGNDFVEKRVPKFHRARREGTTQISR